MGRVSTPIAVGLTIVSEQLSAPAMTRYPRGSYCTNNKAGVIKEFPAQSMAAADLSTALRACETLCLSDAQCTACSVDMYKGAVGSGEAVRWAALSQTCILTNTDHKHWPVLSSSALRNPLTVRVSVPLRVAIVHALDATGPVQVTTSCLLPRASPPRDEES